MSTGGAAYYNHGDTVVVEYRGNKHSSREQPKIVYALCAGHSAAVGNTTKKGRDGNTIPKPTSIISYNHHMGGVGHGRSTARCCACLEKILQVVSEAIHETGDAVYPGFSHI